MRGGVYAITNTVTGEQYIGASSNMHLRHLSHRSLLRRGWHNRKLQQAWDQYGEQSFRFDILEVVEDRQQLEVREAAYMAERRERKGSDEYNASTARGHGLHLGRYCPYYTYYGLEQQEG